MPRLTWTHEITERRKYDTEIVCQTMDFIVDYDPETDQVDVHEVVVYENGKKVCEISTLLDKAEGSPLVAILDAIDWREQYAQQKHYESEGMEPNIHPIFNSIITNAFSHISK